MKKDWMIKESGLDDDQLHIFMASLDKSAIVSGCAGSGKSVLALILAKRIQKEKGDNYQIVVFTKALCKYMNSGKEQLGLTNPFYYHWHWENKLKAPRADYTIVDEIQDFSKDEIEEFISSTNKNFFFFGDTAQSIYEGLKDTIAVDEIKSDIPSARKAKNWELYKNHRLPIPVARFVQTVGVDLPPFYEKTYQNTYNQEPRVIRYSSQEKQLEAIHRLIKNLDDVVILLPNNDLVDEVYFALSKMGGDFERKSKSADTLDFGTTNPKIMTYHSAKGLQFETVFIPFMEDFKEDDDSHQKALYVAMTRTCRDLYVMYSGRLPYPLTEIPRNLYTTTEKDSTSTIKDM